MPPPLDSPKRTQQPSKVLSRSQLVDSAQQYYSHAGQVRDYGHWQNAGATDGHTHRQMQSSRDGFESNALPDCLSQMNLLPPAGTSRARGYPDDDCQEQVVYQQTRPMADGYRHVAPPGLLSLPPRRRASNHQSRAEASEDQFASSGKVQGTFPQLDVGFRDDPQIEDPDARAFRPLVPSSRLVPSSSVHRDMIHTRAQPIGRQVPVQDREAQPHRPSVASPFFSRQEEGPSPPSQAYNRPTPPSMMRRNLPTTATQTSVAPSPRFFRTNPNAPVPARATQALSYRQGGSAYQPEQMNHNLLSQYRDPTPPRRSVYGQTTSQRLANRSPPPVAGSFAAARSTAPTYRNRITMPPSRSVRTFGSSQDPQVSMIRGVRGAGAPPLSGYSRQTAGSGYNALPRSAYPASRSRSRMVVQR